jgi:phospholipid-binding lipoprotein MlaA
MADLAPTQSKDTPLRARPAIVLVAIGALIGANPALAQPSTRHSTPGDPYEATNRRFFASQMGLDKGFFRPLARFYHTLTPGVIGVAVHNVLSNLSEPVIIANDLLQFRLKRAAHDTLRLTANTTAGWLGLIDVATPAGLVYRDNDFGVTLGRWGVKPGPYLFLPLVGPSTVRDAFGLGVDTAMNPLNYINFPDRTVVTISVDVVSALDERVRAEPELNALLADAADPYATLRSVYLQNREAEVRGESAAPLLPPLDDETTPPTGAGSTAPPAEAQPPVDQPSPAAASPAASVAGPITQAAASVPDADAPIATARDYTPRIAAATSPAPAA